MNASVHRLGSPAGLNVELNANGALRRFECNGIVLNLFVGNEMEGGPTNLYLRRFDTLEAPLAEVAEDAFEYVPLLGPASRTRFRVEEATGSLVGTGEWCGIEYSIALMLGKSTPVWFWHVQLTNTTPTAQRVDLTYAQDLALASYGAIRLNEFYVSQYIDHTPLHHASQGLVMASRQNQAVDGRNPWCLVGSLRKAASFATDALQFHGLATRAGAMPIGLADGLPGRRLQHEHSMVILRDEPILLEPNGSVTGGFFGAYRADHPEASSPSDLERVIEVLRVYRSTLAASDLPSISPASTGTSMDPPPSRQGIHPAATLFSAAPLLNGHDLTIDELNAAFGTERRHAETGERGELLSFFQGADRHVVLHAKELLVQRPHGHLLRTGRHITPDESALTSTVWMSGVFHSMLTQGHVSINRFLSTVHSYLGLFRSHGQRVFVEIDHTWHLLNVPSAFEMSPDACRWIYRHDHGVIELRAGASSDPHELTLSIEVTSGAPARFLISHHIALNGDDGSVPGAAIWSRDGDGLTIKAAPGGDVGHRFPNGTFSITPLAGTQFHDVGGDEMLFLDGQSRQQPFLCIATAAGRSVGLRIRGHLIEERTQNPLRVDSGIKLIPRFALKAPRGHSHSDSVARMADIVPWYTHNALVHYLSPRGLEQYSGGGWGTRDVCQGPVEMLLALDRAEPIRDLLLRVLAMQNPDGDWPQWFMFFDRERNIRPGDSHGDIVFWPLLVLAQYLIATGDAGVLEEQVPFFDSRGTEAGERATVWQHAQRALGVIRARVIPNTSLAAYGHGDWNDSLQPANPVMRDHMCSAWTVTLHFQMLTTLARALRAIGRTSDATEFETWAASVQRDFQRLLVVDGVLAGYALFEEGGGVRYLLHPSDPTTGVRYSALAMIHAILEDMLTPAQTREHLRVIETHLSGPDGVRLFDRPMPYHGGPQKLFQRAESATFFGREIGLMYTHAHLRYAQALAHIGAAERFFHALSQANPIGIRSVVPSATLRQANCYYSSSDAAFEDRQQASAEYQRVAQGTIDLDGGWRVYSSGAGIALGLIVRHFLGLNVEADALRLDPVIPSALDGLRVETTLRKRPLEVQFRIGSAGCGVRNIVLNDQPLAFTVGANPHRRGAAVVALSDVVQRLAHERNYLKVELG